jgi:excisionase family DNA binding protein
MPIGLADLPMLATPKQAAEVMGPSESQVRALVRSGALAHVPVGKRVMIPRSAIETYITENTVAPCRDETKARTSFGIAAATAGTSHGLNEVAAGSAQRALKIAASLNSPSRTSSTQPAEETGRVIRLKS